MRRCSASPSPRSFALPHDAADVAVGHHRVLAHLRDVPRSSAAASATSTDAGACSSSARACSASGRSSRSVSTSAPMLIFGDAVVEGMGASLDAASHAGHLVDHVRRRRAGVRLRHVGSVAGFSGVFGPVVGGYLTSYHSWRWAFGINCVVTPMAIVGAYLFVRESTRDQVTGVDYAGAAMVAVGMFLLVFGLSEGEHYGWIVPHRDVIVAGTTLWYAVVGCLHGRRGDGRRHRRADVVRLRRDVKGAARRERAVRVAQLAAAGDSATASSPRSPRRWAVRPLLVFPSSSRSRGTSRRFATASGSFPRGSSSSSAPSSAPA